jgi:lactate dehydrogenase-like 2-hydroxyacid dehydrogenase
VLLSELKRAGGTALINMAVGYNNVDVDAANRNGIVIGNIDACNYTQLNLFEILPRHCSILFL